MRLSHSSTQGRLALGLQWSEEQWRHTARPVAARLQHVFQARRAPHPAENVVARPGETHTSRPPPDNADTGREQTGAPPAWPSVAPSTTHHTPTQHNTQSDISTRYSPEWEDNFPRTEMHSTAELSWLETDIFFMTITIFLLDIFLYIYQG